MSQRELFPGAPVGRVIPELTKDIQELLDKNPVYYMSNPNDPKHWANVKDQYLLSPIYGGDGRVLIKQDDFKSRYDCSKCGGRGHTGEVCHYCLGTKFEKGKEENGYCRDCTVGDTHTSVGKTLGHVPCDLCKGTGGSIVTPDDSKNDTTMGNVIAVSSTDIKCVKQGDKVMYSTWFGNKFEFMGLVLRIGVEKDLFCLVKQLKQNVDSVREQGFADLENTGVPHE